MSDISNHSQSGSSRAAGRAVEASSRQIAELLSERPIELYQALGLKPGEANLSAPTDGRGPRIRASVKRSRAASVPKNITLPVGDHHVTFAVEVTEDFQEFRPLTS